MRRKPLFYVLTQITPTLVVTLLTIIGIFSPSTAAHERQERVTMGLTALMSLAVILMAVADALPKNPHQFPTLGVILLGQVIIIGVATLAAVGVLHVQAANNRQLPDWLLKALWCSRSKVATDEGSHRIKPKDVRIAVGVSRKHLFHFTTSSRRTQRI